MEQIANPEIKIDKRTREYKESVNETSPPKVIGCMKCGGQEDLVTISPQVSLCRSCLDKLNEHTPALSDADLTKIENNPKWARCFRCGADLEAAKRRVKELCESCVWRNSKKAIINGKEFDINPLDPPKRYEEEDARGNVKVEHRDSKGKVYK